MLVHCRLTLSSRSLVGMRGRRLRRKGRGRDFEIKVLDNETARLEPRLYKVVIGKNTFSFLSILTLWSFLFSEQQCVKQKRPFLPVQLSRE